MSDLEANFIIPERVKTYTKQGPPAFAPGHAGLMQMIGVLLSEAVPATGSVLVVGAGGGLETRYLATVSRAGASSASIRPNRCWIWRAPRPDPWRRAGSN